MESERRRVIFSAVPGADRIMTKANAFRCHKPIRSLKMCEAKDDINEIEEFVQILGKVRTTLEAVYLDEVDRLEQQHDVANRYNQSFPENI
jgi:hypothetical protein